MFRVQKDEKIGKKLRHIRITGTKRDRSRIPSFPGNPD